MALTPLKKHGMFFTIIAVFLLMGVVFTFSIYHDYQYIHKANLVTSHITSINYFVEDLDLDATRSLYIAAYRGLLGINQYITDTGNYLNDTVDVVSEVVYLGTIDGVKMNVTEDSYFQAWQTKVLTFADDFNLVLNFTLNNITVYHISPWTLRFAMSMDVYIEDYVEGIEFNYTKNYLADISIIEFEDPLYTIGSSKQLLNDIRRTPYRYFINGTDVSNLVAHMNESYYIESQSAPSYLQRLEGNFSNSTYGIESLVRDYASINNNKTRVDYLYFSSATPVTYFINNTYFKLDDESNHLTVYEVQNISYS